MKWIRTLLIISSIGVLCASSISDDGALGHKRGGGSNDKGQSGGGDRKSGGDEKKSGGEEKKSGGGDSGRSSGGNDNRNNNDNKNNNDSGRSRDRDNLNNGGGGSSSGGQRNNDDRNKNDNSNSGGDRQGHSRDDRDKDRINSGGSGNSGGSRDNNTGSGSGRDTGDRNRDRDRDRINTGGGSSSGGGNINTRDRDQNRDRGSRGDDRIIIGGGGSSSGSSSGSSRTGSSGSGRMSDDYGRVDDRITTGGSRTIGNDPFSKRKPGSSSSGVYGTVNNHRVDRTSSSATFERGRPPIDIFSPSLKGQVRREDNVIKHTRPRSGYYHYDLGWRDDDFYFGYYYFNPVYDRCVVSPFYWYPYVPGYLNRSRVLVMRVGGISIYSTNQPAFFWDSCSSYTYKRTYWYESAYHRSELDYALDDLVNAWEDSNRRSLNRLIPSRGNIGIYIDERYDYSMNADDFYDMMLDNVQNARTKKYDILSVKTYRNEVRVVAVHEYVDPWDRRDRVYHVYRLVNDGDGYVIADFGTSDRRPSR